MLEVIIKSRTRLKILIKFFLFEGIQGYIRGMAKEFNESPNAIRMEINQFVHAGLLFSANKGRKRVFQANPRHPLYPELKSIIRKTVGIDRIIHIITRQTEKLDSIYITGTFAKGIDSETIELVLVGKELDKSKLDELILHAGKLIERKLIYFMVTKEQMKYFFKDKPTQKIWEK